VRKVKTKMSYLLQKMLRTTKLISLLHLKRLKKTRNDISLTIDLSGQDNIIKPTDSRTLRALSAYNQAFNAPLQDQRAQLITGIDAYA